jgi:hypothetical protein
VQPGGEGGRWACEKGRQKFEDDDLENLVRRVGAYLTESAALAGEKPPILMYSIAKMPKPRAEPAEPAESIASIEVETAPSTPMGAAPGAAPSAGLLQLGRDLQSLGEDGS